MRFLSDFLKGLAIGVGAIAPGVSGGALAVIFGIYENLTYAIGNIFKDFKKKIFYLFPIGLGGIAGILIFSNMLEYLFKNYNIEIRYLFIGLMIGTFPSLLKLANKNGFKKNYTISFFIALSSTILFTLLEDTMINIVSKEVPGVLDLIIYGVIVGFGTIVPGVSSSVILMYIGAYNTLLKAIASVNIPLLIPVGIGFVLSFLVLAKVISFLFQYAYGYTYYAVLGFVIGSIVPIFPGVQFHFRYFISFIIMVIGFFISFLLSKYEK
ncbi:DUF368 domain-containing protein [Garciella nitratireducens]|uniref:Putative membrane protein n=1 Tax=Garciella nitratireducens DSM 15102 TaxID=1121911 RepID=A0A1T4KM15_9FIRM|nr:DUF368 domain-containing protein [Garciella nitratireducens]RBP41617.1 putative membrane protein [Garciella nitratireducens]SJZ43413.1 putative membrane protein [Garciella nitratireducens DSM 15102]